ncbi:MAG: XkdX family protein [Bacteroidota bacterium]|nr:XkdX family protein [Bacteroidota bacterium]
MNWVQICTEYYKAGYYNKDSLKTFVIKNKITADEYKTITGIDYVA